MTDLITLPHTTENWQEPTFTIEEPHTQTAVARVLYAATCPKLTMPHGTVSDPEVDFQYSYFPSLSADFLLSMDRMRLHLENKVRQAGHLPLDFTYNDFADQFDDVQGEARVAVFQAVRQWYHTIYVRYLHREQQWRDLYEDETKLTKQQEVTFFEAMRGGSSDPRWHPLFLHRNTKLVGHIVKGYVDKYHVDLGQSPYWKDDNGNQHDGSASLYREERKAARAELFEAGLVGLEKAVEKFDPSRGYKFSTYAFWWIRGEITALFKQLEAEARAPFKCGPAPEPHSAEDYLELRCAVGQALDRLNDPRKAQIIIMRYGLFGGKEHTFKEIGDACGISPQRVHALLPKALEQLKRDNTLFVFTKRWFAYVLRNLFRFGYY